MCDANNKMWSKQIVFAQNKCYKCLCKKKKKRKRNKDQKP